MRNFRTFGENFSLDPVTTQSSGSGGSALTFTTYNTPTDLGENSGSSLTSSRWTVKTSMNLIRFEMSGGWSFIDLSPVYVQLWNSSALMAELEIPSTGVTYEFWTGSVPVEAEDYVWCTIFGGGMPFGEDYLNAMVQGLCVTAWFDNEAGGGLLLYPDPGS